MTNSDGKRADPAVPLKAELGKKNCTELDTLLVYSLHQLIQRNWVFGNHTNVYLLVVFEMYELQVVAGEKVKHLRRQQLDFVLRAENALKLLQSIEQIVWQRC